MYLLHHFILIRSFIQIFSMCVSRHSGMLCVDMSCTTLGSTVPIDTYPAPYIVGPYTQPCWRVLFPICFTIWLVQEAIPDASSLWLCLLPSTHSPGLRDSFVFSQVLFLHRKPATLRQPWSSVNVSLVSPHVWDTSAKASVTLFGFGYWSLRLRCFRHQGTLALLMITSREEHVLGLQTVF